MDIVDEYNEIAEDASIEKLKTKIGVLKGTIPLEEGEETHRTLSKRITDAPDGPSAAESANKILTECPGRVTTRPLKEFPEKDRELRELEHELKNLGGWPGFSKLR